MWAQEGRGYPSGAVGDNTGREAAAESTLKWATKLNYKEWANEGSTAPLSSGCEGISIGDGAAIVTRIRAGCSIVGDNAGYSAETMRPKWKDKRCQQCANVACVRFRLPPGVSDW